jgi:hypothetical protein
VLLETTVMDLWINDHELPYLPTLESAPSVYSLGTISSTGRLLLRIPDFEPSAAFIREKVVPLIGGYCGQLSDMRAYGISGSIGSTTSKTIKLTTRMRGRVRAKVDFE